MWWVENVGLCDCVDVCVCCPGCVMAYCVAPPLCCASPMGAPSRRGVFSSLLLFFSLLSMCVVGVVCHGCWGESSQTRMKKMFTHHYPVRIPVAAYSRSIPPARGVVCSNVVAGLFQLSVLAISLSHYSISHSILMFGMLR